MKNTNNFKQGLSMIGRRIKYFWDKDGAKWATRVGMGGLVASEVYAAKKTWNIRELLEDTKKMVDEAKVEHEGEEKKEWKKRIRRAKWERAKKVAPKYIGPAVATGVSAALVEMGERKHESTEAKLSASVAFIAGSFLNYRNAVIAEQGEEADRRYLTGGNVRGKAKIEGEEAENGENAGSEGKKSGNLTLQADANATRIWFSQETTKSLWSPSLAMRLANLKWVENELDRLLFDPKIGFYYLNDARRYFLGRDGDLAIGQILGRKYKRELSNKEQHVNLHYQEDEDFMNGRTDSCWIILDVDPEPVVTNEKKLRAVEDI